MTRLTEQHAARFIPLTLGHLGREYPHKLDHVMDGPDDVRSPRDLHPIFHGSFDWHSCVHGWWQVLRLSRTYPELGEARMALVAAEQALTAENFSVETAYLERPSSRGFERPYGWAWALALHGEMVRHAAPWSRIADAFAANLAERFKAFLPLQTYPIRVGTHYNSAFALTLAWDWAQDHDPDLAQLICERSLAWFSSDQDCQAWEPGGDEFLSSALCEALVMSRVLGNDFAAWFDAFLPRIPGGEPAALFTPALVSDRSDGKIAHLDGLNLSRAWCWREIAKALPPGHSSIDPAEAAAQRHLESAMPHIAGDYMGEHWLATFAVLALQA